MTITLSSLLKNAFDSNNKSLVAKLLAVYHKLHAMASGALDASIAVTTADLEKYRKFASLPAPLVLADSKTAAAPTAAGTAVTAKADSADSKSDAKIAVAPTALAADDTLITGCYKLALTGDQTALNTLFEALKLKRIPRASQLEEVLRLSTNTDFIDVESNEIKKASVKQLISLANQTDLFLLPKSLLLDVYDALSCNHGLSELIKVFDTKIVVLTDIRCSPYRFIHEDLKFAIKACETEGEARQMFDFFANRGGGYTDSDILDAAKKFPQTVNHIKSLIATYDKAQKSQKSLKHNAVSNSALPAAIDLSSKQDVSTKNDDPLKKRFEHIMSLLNLAKINPEVIFNLVSDLIKSKGQYLDYAKKLIDRINQHRAYGFLFTKEIDAVVPKGNKQPSSLGARSWYYLEPSSLVSLAVKAEDQDLVEKLLSIAPYRFLHPVRHGHRKPIEDCDKKSAALKTCLEKHEKQATLLDLYFAISTRDYEEEWSLENRLIMMQEIFSLLAQNKFDDALKLIQQKSDSWTIKPVFSVLGLVKKYDTYHILKGILYVDPQSIPQGKTELQLQREKLIAQWQEFDAFCTANGIVKTWLANSNAVVSASAASDAKANAKPADPLKGAGTQSPLGASSAAALTGTASAVSATATAPAAGDPKVQPGITPGLVLK